MNKARKITIIGAGNVGATIGYALMHTGITSEILFIDINKDKAEGEALDLEEGTAFIPPVSIKSGDYKDAVNSDIVIITSGRGRQPGQTRLDLAEGNINIIKSIVPQIEKYAKDALYIIVSNPVDILTYTVIKNLKNVSSSKVIGSGTMLDSSRLRNTIAQDLKINPQLVKANVMGEHGDSAMVPWSMANIEGMPIEDLYNRYNIKFNKDEILTKVHKAGGEIIKRKGATFYAIGLSVANLCVQLIRDSKSILTVSTIIDYPGVGEVCVSLPCRVGINGIEEVIMPKFLESEKEMFKKSCISMRNIIDNTNAGK